MPVLLNQFDLKPTANRDRFDLAWAAFIAHLVQTDLATGASPLMARDADSGFDTDTARGHGLMATIDFRDQPQADAAWAAIEAGTEPLGGLHRAVFAQVHDPVFTFWSER